MLTHSKYFEIVINFEEKAFNSLGVYKGQEYF